MRQFNVLFQTAAEQPAEEKSQTTYSHQIIKDVKAFVVALLPLETDIMASRLPVSTVDVDKERECTFYRWWCQQSDPNERRGDRQKGGKQEYTDADFAREMQGLSFQERERVYEDVHLASGQVKETEEFVTKKVKELIEFIDNHSKKRVQRDAWDRAVFLRPALATDRDHHLMFLRARNYDAYDAAMLLFKCYETKRRLWGDELLALRICWDDLSEETRAVYKQFYCIFLPRNKESPIRQIWYDRSRIAEPNVDPIDYVRATMYSSLCNTFGNEEIHRKGQIAIVDLRGGPFKKSTFQYLDETRITAPMMDSIPARATAVHFLIERSAMAGFARSIQAVLSRNNRLRVRIHAGSWTEIQYSLRSYGIDIAADWLDGDVEGSPFSSEYTEATTQEYLRNEEKLKRNEAPYCDPSSDFALYPNSQDIVMGKNRKIASSWPGNMAYTALIHEYTAGYRIATRSEKTTIANEILHRLKSEFRVRFLSRKDNVGWEALSDEEARVKVSQSLRDEYRKIFKTGAF